MKDKILTWYREGKISRAEAMKFLHQIKIKRADAVTALNHVDATTFK